MRSTGPICNIVVLTHNSSSHICTCLNSLREISASIDVRILIVDNASTDDSVEVALASGVEFDLLRSVDNLGYAAGNNLAIRRLLDDAQIAPILLLNPDVTLDCSTLRRLLAVIDSRPHIGIVSPSLITPDGPTKSSFRGLYHWRNFNACPDDSKLILTDRAHGCCMLVRPDVFRTAGLLDEDYFLYFEEVDFCYEAAKRSWQVAICRDAQTGHASNSAKTHRIFYMWRNAVRFTRRQVPAQGGLTRVLAQARFWSSMTLQLISSARMGGLITIAAAAEGLTRGIQGEVGASPSKFGRPK